MEVLVEHDYIAKESNELTISKGDIIKDVIKKQDGWWEGTLKDKKGLFPDNYVKVIDRDSVVLRSRKDASRIRQCRVVFSYKQDHEDELNLNVGDVIEILGEEEEGWWRGVLNGKEGVFPSNFVEEIVPLPIVSKHNSKENLTNCSSGHENTPAVIKATKTICEVKFAYKAQNEDELTLKEGDLVTLISKDGQDPGWWKGELNGVVGVFPDNFVTVLPQVPEDLPHKDDKKHQKSMEPVSVKPSTIQAQRKSLESVINESESKTPPLPAKKPTIPVKKSPSSGSTSGILFGLKKKFVDVVDGATGSKISPSKVENSDGENAFDDVHRRPLLSDVRASRPKAPGRRPPTAIGKEPEPGLMNGNSDHHQPIEPTIEQSPPIEPDPETKPKLREWVKHPAPWLEEMKLNQAKRISTSPGSEKLKLTPEKPEDETTKPKKEPSPVAEKSKSIANLNPRVKVPTNEPPMVRNKPNVATPNRHTIQNMTLTDLYRPKVKSPEGQGGGDGEEVSKLAELERRLARLEEAVERERVSHEAAVEELRGKLQLETELRMKLQAKVEKLAMDGAIQQL